LGTSCQSSRKGSRLEPPEEKKTQETGGGGGVNTKNGLVERKMKHRHRNSKDGRKVKKFLKLNPARRKKKRKLNL